MATIFKFSWIFRFDPDTTIADVSTPGKVGGLSENYWVPREPLAAERQTWANLRAACMAADMTITGWRLTQYDYTRNVATPQAAQVGTLFKPGAQGFVTNSPDDALRVQGVATLGRHSWTFFLRGLPDICITSAQYVATVSFDGPIRAYLAALTSGTGIGQVISFFGRDPTTTVGRVLALGAGPQQVLSSSDLGVTSNQDSVIFHRAYDQNKRPVKGTYLVTAQAPQAGGAVLYTLAGLAPVINTQPSGSIRKAQLVASPAISATIKSVGERKAGRPLLAYRGRRTRTH